MVNILHISDIHFPSEHMVVTERELKQGIVNFLDNTDDENIYLLISGDITFQGKPQGYKEATLFFKEVIEKSKGKIDPKNILLCPGNHDIVEGSNFELFDKFSYTLRGDSNFSYNNGPSYVIKRMENALFLGINSVYHLDHQFGFVNIEELGEKLKSMSINEGVRRIAFTHHHLVNQFQRDTSSIRNASQLISLLDHYGFETIFHGHQHTNSNLILGKSQMFTIGVSTPGFEMQGYTNGINYYKINQEGLESNRYVYSRDNESGGLLGSFKVLDSKYYTR
ncbi:MULTISPECIES: metallophosphoesterase family protein [Pontibacillus]|uniref:Metallophosphoesterase n=1 Tax=Pontibacillus chungwhensis TaxID=265426 RepID=A0ABY8UYG7_9BACI|nr:MULTISPECIES: metallophosphoesterase [Pontibacillus]MCD5325948.1 metallophosphoesterase [Pontibacillus sp. HN14]WIF98405.1 metallophosphoesterase [Pontibacillus chungwhensis]